jgi:hypothetical protein
MQFYILEHPAEAAGFRSRSQLNVRVRPDQSIKRNQRAVVVPGGGDDQLVGWVAVKDSRQLRRADRHFRGKRQQLDRRLQGLRQPPVYWDRQL